MSYFIFAVLAVTSSFISFAQAQAPLNNVASSLTVYVYPPRHRINWSTPKSTINDMINMEIAASLARNDEVEFISDFNEPGTMSSSYRSTMGHTISHVQCNLPNGQYFDRWTSFTGQNYGKADKVELIDKKLGAGVLFYDYIDGAIIAGQENWKRLAFYQGESTSAGTVRPRYFQLEITPRACAGIKDMIAFFESFHFPPGTTIDQLEQLPDHERLFFSAQLDPYETYMQRKTNPYARVGGGCAPYGAGLIKMAGRYENIFESFFRRPLTISERLIGGIIDPYTNRIREVTIPELTRGRLGDNWVYAGYDNRYLSLYDPQLIWDFVGHLMKCTTNPGRCNTAVDAWMSSQASVYRGQRQIFREKYMAVIGPITGPSGKPTERIEKEVEQPVDGMVWRLSH